MFHFSFFNPRFFFVSLLIQLSIFLSPLFSNPPRVEDLSIEEKVGQLLIAHFHGDEPNEEAERLIKEALIGGVIYYNWANGLHNPVQVHQLSRGLQEMASQTRTGIPLFLAVDQEGGVVNRLTTGFTLFPGNYALGRTKRLDWGQESARMVAVELNAVGINLNLAPVLDGYTNPMNSVIGIRAFSKDPMEIASWGDSFLQGHKQGGVVAVLKHFPGHGDVEIDSHEELPIVFKSRQELEQVELLPFRQLAPRAEMIMTAHLFVPELDEDHCVTFSRSIVEDLLRGEMNFQGVVMTDSLIMQGILDQCSSLEEAVIKSFEAGHDLILLGGKQLHDSQKGMELLSSDVIRIHQFLVQAVKKGRISEQRLDVSVERILALKQSYELFDLQPLHPSLLEEHVNVNEHRMLAQQIAKNALHLVQGKKHLLLNSEKQLIVAPSCLKCELEKTSWISSGDVIYYNGLNPDQNTIEMIKKAAVQKGKVVFCAYHCWKNLAQKSLFNEIVQISPFVIALVVRDPMDQHFLGAAKVVLSTYSPTACSLEAAFECLHGKQ